MAVAARRIPPLTVDDLDHFPDDGCRYELIEGDLHVSAAPRYLHQRALQNLLVLLARACPPEFEILPGPGVVLGPATQLEPDFCIVPVPEGEPGRKVEEPPVVVCEVLSPSTRRYDTGTKRPVYRDAGVGAMWVVDADVPSVTVWRWEDDAETEQHAEGEHPLTIDWPFEVTIVPARLTEPGGTRA